MTIINQILLRRIWAERMSPPRIFLKVKFEDCGCSSSRACSAMAAFRILTSASSSSHLSSSFFLFSSSLVLLASSASVCSLVTVTVFSSVIEAVTSSSLVSVCLSGSMTCTLSFVAVCSSVMGWTVTSEIFLSFSSFICFFLCYS